jgi:hypothetical protein
MDTVTHALLPVICTGLVAGNAKWLGRWGLVGIGIAGALPDLLTPHLSLEARMTSWSHGIPCWLAFSSVLIICSIFIRRGFSTRLALFQSGAYLLHMACDAISGGVNFLYPFGNWTWGDYWVDPIWWVPLDIICVLTCYVMFRFLPGLNARRAARSPSMSD